MAVKKHSAVLVFSMAVALLACDAQSNNEVTADTALAEQACLQTMYDYAIYRDEKNAKEYAALFTEQGEYLLSSEKYYQGQAELAGYIDAMPDTARSIHHITTSKFDVLDDKNLKGTTYLYLELWDSASENQGKAMRKGSAIYKDELVLIDGRCKIKKRVLTSSTIQ